MREVPLTKGQVALVSDQDYERVMQFKWCASFGSRNRKYYALRKTRKAELEKWHSQHIRLGHFILGVTVWELGGLIIDHIDDNSMNYQRENLQIITQEENMNKVPGWKKKDQPAMAGRDRSGEW